MNYTQLPNRGVIALHGSDTKNFLQSIITNDINKLDHQKAIYSLLLNPQGKYLYDFFLIAYGKYIFLECESIYLTQIIVKLDLLKTYLKVRIKDVNALYKVGVFFNTKLAEHSNRLLSKPIYGKEFLGEVQASTTEYLDVFEEHSSASTTKLPSEIELCKKSNESQIIFQDPRHTSLGVRIIHKNEITEQKSTGDSSKYELIRIRNLVPDGAKDMVQNSSFPLQYLVDHINGIDFNKGCYIGQEVVNRMKRQQTLRRKLYLVQGNRVLPSIGTKVVTSDSEEVGELRSSVNNIGFALLYTEKNHANLSAGEVKISVL